MNPVLQLRRYARQEDRILKAFEKRFAKAILLVLRKQTKEAIDNRGIFLDYGMYDVMSELYKDVFLRMAREQYDVLTRFTQKNDFFLNTWSDFITQYILNNMAKRVTGINDTTRKKIAETIAIANLQGLTTEETARLLTERFEKFNVFRATMIARTEIAEAANIAKDRSAEDWEREVPDERLYKVWIKRYANDPRDWHQALDNNKAIPKEQPFLVTDNKGFTVEMQRPHDPNGGAQNNVNCSCVVVYVSDSYAKRLNSSK